LIMSPDWDHFEIVEEIGGVRIMKCIHYGQSYRYHPKSIGTYHLWKHVNKCLEKQQRRQLMLQL
ncbi:hypothetical protein HAX54_036702, partial [Datura stramonium]|nr:hypothetical protein [Datura stramonium]